MALIERVLQDSSEPTDRHISAHTFYAAGIELLTGHVTSAQVQAHFNMTAADLVDWNALVAQFVALPTTLDKLLFIERFHACFLAAHDGVAGYSTAAQLRTKLGI